MPKMIQLRHVPDRLHRTLKARAALAGLSLSAYVIGELKRSAEWLPIEKLRRRLARLPPWPCAKSRSMRCAPSGTPR
jgi:hypothetical protein